MTDIDNSQVQFATKLAHRSIQIVIGFSLFGLFLLTAERFISNHWLSQDYAKLAAAENIAGRLLLADERMTNAAVSYAAGASPVWKSDYDKAVPQLETAFNDAKTLVSADVAVIFEKATGASSRKLKGLDAEAFALAKKSNHMAAIRVLRSVEYSISKSILRAGSAKMLATLKSEVEDTIAKTNLIGAALVVALLLMGGLSFGLIWRRLTKALHKSEVAFFTAEQQIRDELSTAHVAMLRHSKMSQLGQLTATIAHELRNPLGSVRTSAFLLERKYIASNPEMIGPMTRIKAGIVRCDNIITQLLDYSRNTVATKLEVVIDDWLEKTINEQAEDISALVAIECDLGLGKQKVGIDPDRMQRVMINLMNNAIEAMIGKGDKPLPAGAPTPTLTIQSKLVSRGIEIRVVDNGPGIAAEVLPKIFDPLFTTKNFGTGLGLPAVQKILEQHSGGLEVHSIVGEGATFIAWLPIVQRDMDMNIAA